MVTLFQGEKHWHCRVFPTENFELFITNNVKVDVKFAASHFLGNRLQRDKKDFEEGEFIVFIKDLAEGETYRVLIKRHIERTKFGKRVRPEVLQVEKVL